MTRLPDSDPDQLLCLARAGDSSALGRLLELYRSYLELLARLQLGRLLQGKADPSDLVQDTFLAAHAHFAQFRGSSEEELAGWPTWCAISAARGGAMCAWSPGWNRS
jgi:RNA polymerase sigma-70 factor (ECF subfamily)